MAVPLYDTASVMYIRWRQGRPVFKGDRSHTHHRFLAAGFSETTAVLFIWLLTFLTGISSIVIMKADLFVSILVFVQVGLAFALIIVVKHVRLKKPYGGSYREDTEGSDMPRDADGECHGEDEQS
jgi:UDP-GlcNAc:undecaprenyl-phosphate GlcNAc-1-phosphate transferase